MKVKVSYIFIIIVATITLFLAQSYFKKIQMEAVAKSRLEHEKQLEAYQNSTKNIENPYLATKRGLSFLKNGEIEKACFVLQRATELDVKYRDSHLYLGYAYLKAIEDSKNNLNAKEKIALLQKAKEALLNAQKIDPIYPVTNKLLQLVAESTNDKEKALWYARYETLSGKTLSEVTKSIKN